MAKGGSGAALAEQKKSRREARQFNMLSMKQADKQFKESQAFQREQLAQMAAFSATSPIASDSTRDMASASNEIARQAASRTSFRKFRF
jgi:hypothetical protein